MSHQGFDPVVFFVIHGNLGTQRSWQASQISSRKSRIVLPDGDLPSSSGLKRQLPSHRPHPDTTDAESATTPSVHHYVVPFREAYYSHHRPDIELRVASQPETPLRRS